jgi:hypothetical protein
VGIDYLQLVIWQRRENGAAGLDASGSGGFVPNEWVSWVEVRD